MEEAPDMDDLLDEMEADLVSRSRPHQRTPPPQPISNLISSSTPEVIKVKKLLPNPMFNDKMEGSVTIDTSDLPNVFKPEPVIHKMTFEPKKVETVPEKVEINNKSLKIDKNVEKTEEMSPKPETITDLEYEEALDYLNGFEEKLSETDQTEDVKNVDVTNHKITENLLKEEAEFLSVEDSAGQVAEMLMNEISSDLNNLLIEKITETVKNGDKSEAEDEIIDQNRNEKEIEREIEKLDNPIESSSEEEMQTIIEVVPSSKDEKATESNEQSTEDVYELPVNKDVEAAPEVVEEIVEEVLEKTVKKAVEDAVDEGVEIGVEQGNEVEEDKEIIDNRPRFDSSIATIHVLNESDSDDAPTPKRERRLTESELQLGKTCPYWIPDADCQFCMLCSTKFTIITRRHHCRACGRVLCGSCCNEKSILEYLNEPGKKLQPVRVCKPCFGMLARIEAYEQELITNGGQENIENRRNSGDDVGSSPSSGSVITPKGVLKMRSATSTDNDESAASTSNSTAGTSSTNAEGNSVVTAKRSVVFRDGVRPGAHSEESEPVEVKSTALKPKKKSRKRHSVVRRCAELRMEEELSSALPNETRKTWLILNTTERQIEMMSTSSILETLRNLIAVNVMLKKNLTCLLKIVQDEKFGWIWTIATDGFAQIGLDEIFMAWKMKENEINQLGLEMELSNIQNEEEIIPLVAFERISKMYEHSTESEYAGVRRVGSRFSRLHSVQITSGPIPNHILLFRPSLQTFKNYAMPKNPFLVACFLLNSELQWATACPDRLLNRLGLEYGCYPTPVVNDTERKKIYSEETMGTVLKIFTDFQSWTYRMRHIAGCTVSLTNETTTIRIPRSALADLNEVIRLNRSMLSWRCDFSVENDGVLICDESDAGLYNTQVLTRFSEKRGATGATFVVLDGGSKVNSLQVNVIEDGVSIRVQSERLESILTEIQNGNNIVETSKEMEFRVEFIEDDEIKVGEFSPRSMIDGAVLMNKYQYGLSLDRALTQVLQVQGISDFGVRLSHVYNLREGRLCPEDEPRIYGMAEIAAKECVAMLEPFMKILIATGVGSLAIRLMVSMENIEYDVSKWEGLEEESEKFRQSLDQLIPILYSMTEYVSNGFAIELVLSIVSTRPLPI